MRDLAPVQTVRSSGAWVNDAVYLPGQRKLLVAAMDRTVGSAAGCVVLRLSPACRWFAVGD